MELFQNIYNGILKVFGDIKVFKWPLFIVYDPGSYKVKGRDAREILDIVQPGDILLRGYDNYLDGLFIPGKFSHAGLYVGEVTDTDLHKLSNDSNELFHTGKQMVVHAMAEGVFIQDVLDFARTDRMVILRFPKTLKAIKKMDRDTDYHGIFTKQEQMVFDSLNNDEDINFIDIVPMIFDIALSQVGKKYDFNFNFKNYNDLSCTEFVHYCIKSLEGFHQIKPIEKKFLFYSKSLIVPDAFTTTNLEMIWESRSVR